MDRLRTDLDVAAAYDARADEYIQVAGTLDRMDARDRALIESWRDATPGLLVDAGCGPGHWTALLSSGGRDVRGFDVSESFIGAARSRHPQAVFEVGSFRDLPLATASVGGILAWYSLIHTPPTGIAEVLDEFARVLAPGGGILLGLFDGQPREPFEHAIAPAWFWSPDALGELLADAGFAVTSMHRRERTPEESSVRAHADLSAIRVASASRG